MGNQARDGAAEHPPGRSWLPEGLLRAVSDTALEGIWAAEPDGQTVFANNKLAEILGVTLETVYASCAPDLFGAGDDRAPVVERLRRPSDDGVEQHEVIYAHPDGHQRVLRLSVSSLLDETRAMGSLVMVTDISDQRSAEQELRRRGLY